MKWINLGTLLLVVVGGLYLGAIALGGNGDLLANMPWARAAFGIIGLSALWQLAPLFRSWRVGEVEAEAHPPHAHPTR